MNLYIKNMVCSRCKMVVKAELEKLGFKPLSVELGEVGLSKAPSESEKARIDAKLREFGFSLIDDKKSRIIGKIKALIVELVHQQDGELKHNLSEYLSSRLLHDYSYITHLFSEVEGTTIEQYFISQKIERVKELLVYDELNLSEIAHQLNYSSVSHLSKQFKKVTGLTPSHFKQLRENKRRSLEDL